MKKFFVIVIAIILAITIASAGCIGNPENVNPAPVIKVTDHKNGVYYFDAVGDNYMNTLSAFISTHPELRYVSATSDNRGVGGVYDSSRTQGYIVVFEPRGDCCCTNLSTK